jgi:hypothetical protein
VPACSGLSFIELPTYLFAYCFDTSLIGKAVDGLEDQGLQTNVDAGFLIRHVLLMSYSPTQVALPRSVMIIPTYCKAI